MENELLSKSEWDIGLPTQPVYLMNSQYTGFSDEDAFRSHHTQEMHYALNLLGFSASKINSSRVLLMNKSYTLMTFNISKDLKSRFDALTEIHQVTKTSVLIEFIETYCQKQEFKNVKF